ncbi:MAG: histidine phosphatase family protein [Alphaproteobacteria bacterium]|nr:MAG: histidine phosphatase family protein [Alphaproteobacteria bacterium]
MADPARTEPAPARGTLVICRHGQTDYNVQHLMTGRRDIPLNADGEAQAKEAGQIISVFHFDKAYSSTLSRAFNTAAAALESSGTNNHLKKEDGSWDVEKRREIVELDTGDFTGRNHKTDPEIIAFERHYERPLPGGESDAQVVERVRKFYEDEILPRMAKGETVLVVSHSGIMRAFDIVLGFREPPEGGKGQWTHKTRVPNATPTVVEYQDGVMVNHYQLDNHKVPPAVAPPPANQNAVRKRNVFRPPSQG